MTDISDPQMGELPTRRRPFFTASAEARDTEAFWRGKFGADYAKRSPGDIDTVAAMLHRIVNRRPIHSALELGAGSGTNLRALQMIDRHMELTGVEVNGELVEQWTGAGVEWIVKSAVDFSEYGRQWDMAFTRGLLIHIQPEHLPRVYEALVRSARRYVMIAEYYNPTPVEVTYRGHAGKLWKRDFAGEILAANPCLRLIDYGFVYHGDTLNPQDDVTWFLMEKQQ
jgi:pseudaminic acid biosynthesis-associated methylase